GHHPIMGLVGRDRLLDQPRSDQVEGFAFPGLLLAPVLDQLGGAEAEPQGAEAATGIDRRQRPVIADQHPLGPGPVGMLKQSGELAGADHTGLIDHQHGAGVQLLLTLIQVEQESVAGVHLFEPRAARAQGGDAGRAAARSRYPSSCQACRAMPRAKVLPVPARPTTTATPWPPWQRSRTMACWSGPAVGWAARASRTASWETVALF